VFANLAQEVAQLTLLGEREALEPPRRASDHIQQPIVKPLASFCQDDVLDAAVVGARLSCDESSCLESVDEAGDIRVVAGQERGEFVHRQRRGQLQERSRLRGVQVKLGGRDQKSPPLLSLESAQ